MAENTKEAQPELRDKFAPERRFEQRYPEVTHYVHQWMQGYERNRESTLAILTFLEKQYEVNNAIAQAIRELCV